MAAKVAGGSPLKGNEYATAAAFRRALQDRLAAAAKSEGVDLQRIRRQVAFDRLLARLFSNYCRVCVILCVTLATFEASECCRSFIRAAGERATRIELA